MKLSESMTATTSTSLHVDHHPLASQQKETWPGLWVAMIAVIQGEDREVLYHRCKVEPGNTLHASRQASRDLLFLDFSSGEYTQFKSPSGSSASKRLF
jgi:hypothetical protein